jgi:RNA polymerase subunit RPABC4/transcription elongation factor Spt4
VAGSATETLVRRAAMEEGMRTIGQDGLAKVLAGETSLEEVQRVVYYEEELGHLCVSCRRTVAPDHVFCPHCGTPSSSSCRSCGRRVDPEWEFCPSCGGPHAAHAVPAPEPEPLVGEEPPVAPARSAPVVPGPSRVARGASAGSERPRRA